VPVQTTTDAQGAFLFDHLETTTKLTSTINTCRNGGSCAKTTSKLTVRKKNWKIRDNSTGNTYTSLLFDSLSPQSAVGLAYTATPD
jgi:hypothetical protein